MIMYPNKTVLNIMKLWFRSNPPVHNNSYLLIEHHKSERCAWHGGLPFGERISDRVEVKKKMSDESIRINKDVLLAQNLQNNAV
ncbi:MAG: hypothetical protein EZS28_043147, partial [Streblomastix strix]